MKKLGLEVELKLEHQIYIIEKGTPKRVYLLLHGYLLDGKYLLDTLKDTLPEDSLIIAPNGPFLVPVKKNERYKTKFAWYFFDPHKQNFYIDFEPASHYAKKVLDTYNTQKLPVTIIGYSQGGYLAPRIGNADTLVDSVIGMACAFRSSRFEFNEKIKYSQINSRSDLVVDFEGALSEFEKIKEKGNLGEFYTLNDSGHRIDKFYLEQLKTILPT
jgi:predicted esterase